MIWNYEENISQIQYIGKFKVKEWKKDQFTIQTLLYNNITTN